MFELPELLGSPYIMPAIIIVVALLLLLLLITMVRRRRARSAGRSRTSGGKTATGRSAEVALAAGGDTVAGYKASDSPGRHAAPATRSAATVLSSDTDPVGAVITDLLQGWGDITTEDTNRLRIFRADRVASALAAAELPKNLKNSEQARARLGQLRHYALSLPQTPTADLEETAGEERAAAASWGIEKTDVFIEPTDNRWGTADAASVAASTGDIAPPPADAGDTPPDAALSWYGAVLADKTPDNIGEVSPTAAPVEEAFLSSPAGPAGESTHLQADVFETGEPGAALPVGDDEHDKAVMFQEEPRWPVEEVPVELSEEPLPQVDEVDVFAEYDEVGPEEGATVDTVFTGLGTTITTADELLQLPSDEQAGMLAFISAAELGKAFRQTDQPDLKRAIVDTLEHIGNTAALDVIHDCLDDPDPEIQAYALDAADRLLGVDE